MSDFKAIILAGGSGERFWPLSTPEKPKQFLRVFGGESLIRQSVSRLGDLAKPNNVFVITSKALVAATRRELPEIPAANVIGEPMRRDTGAAVALGVAAAGDGLLGFFSSDQLITKPVSFRKTIRQAIRMAGKKVEVKGRGLRRNEISPIVTIGIRPTYPATGFGYVDPKTGVFVEKPNERRARMYLKKGFLWNAGMFIGRAEAFKKAFADHAPALLQLATLHPAGRGASAFGLRLEKSSRAFARLYESLPRISFDYAVMEKLARVKVVKGDFGWDDVGSYGAFDKYFPHDARGNVREGPCTVVEADGNICVARSARISLLGVKNLVVVTTPDSVLVADKSRLTEMKKLFR